MLIKNVSQITGGLVSETESLEAWQQYLLVQI